MLNQEDKFLEQYDITTIKDGKKIIYQNKFQDKFTFNCTNSKHQFFLEPKMLNFFSKNNILKDKNIIIQLYFTINNSYPERLTVKVGIENTFKLIVGDISKINRYQALELDDHEYFIHEAATSFIYVSVTDPNFTTQFIKLINRHENINYFNEHKHLYKSRKYSLDCTNSRYELSVKQETSLEKAKSHICGIFYDLDVKDSNEIKKLVTELIAKKEIEQNKKQFNETLKKIPEHVSEKLTLKNKDKYKSVLNELVDKSNKKQDIDDTTFLRISQKYKDILQLVDFGLDKEEITRIFIEEYGKPSGPLGEPSGPLGKPSGPLGEPSGPLGKQELDLFLTVAFDYKDFLTL